MCVGAHTHTHIPEKELMCGTGVKAPIANASAFVNDVIVIDGPASANAAPKRECAPPVDGKSSQAWRMRNASSTPVL